MGKAVRLESEWERLRGEVADCRRAEERRRLEQHRIALLDQDLTAATGSRTLEELLRAFTNALVRHLGVTFARVWLLRRGVLELCARAGLYTHFNGAHGRIAMGQYKIGRIAQERRPHPSNQVIGDPNTHDQDWARREGMVAFAGYPLLSGDRIASSA